MENNIKTDLYAALSQVVETYPVILAFEERTSLHIPCAIYHIKENGTKTKEGIKNASYEVNIIIWTQQHDDLIVKADAVKRNVAAMQDKKYNPTFISSDEGFDGDDRLYYIEINYNIKKF